MRQNIKCRRMSIQDVLDNENKALAVIFFIKMIAELLVNSQ